MSWKCHACGRSAPFSAKQFPLVCPCGKRHQTIADAGPPGLLARRRQPRPIGGHRDHPRDVSRQTSGRRTAGNLQGLRQYYDPKNQVCQHPQCGCRVRGGGLLNKVAWSHEACPIGKWLAVSSQPLSSKGQP